MESALWPLNDKVETRLVRRMRQSLSTSGRVRASRATKAEAEGTQLGGWDERAGGAEEWKVAKDEKKGAQTVCC